MRQAFRLWRKASASCLGALYDITQMFTWPLLRLLLVTLLMLAFDWGACRAQYID